MSAENTQAVAASATVAAPAKTKAKQPDAVSAKAQEIAQDVISQELGAVREAYDAYLKACGLVKSMGLQRLAEELAKTADLKTGRPQYAEWHRYVTVVSITRPSAESQDKALRHARKLFVERITEGNRDGKLEASDIAKLAERFVKSKTSGDAKGTVSSKLTLALPAAWAIAMGV